MYEKTQWRKIHNITVCMFSKFNWLFLFLFDSKAKSIASEVLFGGIYEQIKMKKRFSLGKNVG